MRIALMGDIHGAFGDADLASLAAADLDLVLFTGDLAWLTGNAMFTLARRVGKLEKPYAIIAGNHDCTTLASLLGEIAGQDWPARLAANRIVRRYQRLAEIFGARLVAYSAVQAGGFSVVGARPFAMEGGRLSFAEPLRRLFGIGSLAESADRLTDLVRQAPGEVILLAHNGPAGAGRQPDDPFGVDFRAGGGDNGDPDLAAALGAGGSRVRLVVAGHMHHAVAHSTRLRRYWYREGSTLVVNAARVPRHTDGRSYRLDVELGSNETLLQEVESSLTDGHELERRELARFDFASASPQPATGGGETYARPRA